MTDKILVVMEWEKYLYLYKYNSCCISESGIAEINKYDMYRTDDHFTHDQIRSLERIIPIFDRDMDVIFLEYDKRHLYFDSGIRLVFNGVVNLIPLSNEAHAMLSTRIPKDIKLSKPISQSVFDRITSHRRSIFRSQTVNSLLSIYEINIPEEGEGFIKKVHLGVEKIGSISKDVDKSSILYNVLTFDITPSFIPEGNVESIIKLGCIVYRAKGTEIENIRNGPFFKACMRFSSEINAGTIYEGYMAYSKMVDQLENNEKDSIIKLTKELTKEFSNINILLVYFIYLSLNRKISKEDFDLQLVHEDLLELSAKENKSLFYALAIFGSVHSFDRLYESIHRLNNSPLFNTNKMFSENQKSTTIKSNQVDSLKDSNLDEKITTNADVMHSEGIKPNKELEVSSNKPENIDGGKKELTLALEFDDNGEHVENETYNNTLSYDGQEAENLHGHQNYVADNFISKMENVIDLKKGDKELWEELKLRIRELKEINLSKLESILRKKPFITSNNKPTAASDRFKSAIKKCS